MKSASKHDVFLFYIMRKKKNEKKLFVFFLNLRIGDALYKLLAINVHANSCGSE